MSLPDVKQWDNTFSFDSFRTCHRPCPNRIGAMCVVMQWHKGWKLTAIWRQSSYLCSGRCLYGGVDCLTGDRRGCTTRSHPQVPIPLSSAYAVFTPTIAISSVMNRMFIARSLISCFVSLLFILSYHSYMIQLIKVHIIFNNIAIFTLFLCFLGS